VKAVTWKCKLLTGDRKELPLSVKAVVKVQTPAKGTGNGQCIALKNLKITVFRGIVEKIRADEENANATHRAARERRIQYFA
jgi:hypothetical protein